MMAGKSLNRMGMSAGTSQNALRNLIFMAEDASAVYGTQGLSGVLRAASNNLTMVAMAFGPVAMGATVAATSIAQLVLAFNKSKDTAKQAADEVNYYKQALDEFSSVTRERAAFAVDFGSDFDAESLRGKLVDANKAMEEAKIRLQTLGKEQQKLRATQVFIESDAGGGDEGRAAFQEQLIALAEKQKEAVEQLNKARREGTQIQERLVRLAEQERDQQTFIRESLAKTNQVADEVERNRLNRIEERNKAEHEAERQRNIAASNNRFHRILKEQKSEEKTLEQEVNEIVKQRLHSKQVESMVAAKMAQLDTQRLGIETERSRVASQRMGADQLIAQRQSSIQVDRNAAMKKSAMMAGMSPRDRAAVQIAERKANQVQNNNRGKFEERRAKEVERTNSLLEQMITDGLKTKSGSAVAG